MIGKRTLTVRLFSTTRLVQSPPLVDAAWLHSQLSTANSINSNIKLLDASYHIPLRLRIPSTPETMKEKIRSALGMGSYLRLENESPHVQDILVKSDDEVDGSVARDAKALFADGQRIQDSQFFDLSVIRDVLKSQPLIAPSHEDFGGFMDELGIRNSDHVVVYDTVGIHSSPRAWWIFKLMGHENVSVLDGGLPEWIKSGYPVINITTSKSTTNSDPVEKYIAHHQSTRVKEYQDMMGIVVDLMAVSRPIILDVRDRERHLGVGVDPLHTTKKMGTIPGSINIHWKEFLDGNKLKKPLDIIRTFKGPGRSVNLDHDLVIYGNDGISAAVVCLALEVLGKESGVAVYDGGWAEWGMNDASPITHKGY
ncbi:UNVERIFIED_CONTAM: threonyl-tRNA synthetase [Siphonaria sp. JEL0065]|nr:threonyl-tRNA synthetase [Siphonaria sp. JEL0065]